LHRNYCIGIIASESLHRNHRIGIIASIASEYLQGICKAFLFGLRISHPKSGEKAKE